MDKPYPKEHGRREISLAFESIVGTPDGYSTAAAAISDGVTGMLPP